MSARWGGYGWDRGRWDGLSTAPPAPLPSALTLFEAIRDRLKADASLTGLTEVFKNKPKRGWVYPYLVISRVHGTSEITNTPEYWEDEEFQFAVISSDDIEAEALGLAARKLLMPKSPLGKLRFQDGYDIVRLPTTHGRLIEQPHPERGPGNVNSWMYVFGIMFNIGRVQT